MKIRIPGSSGFSVADPPLSSETTARVQRNRQKPEEQRKIRTFSVPSMRRLVVSRPTWWPRRPPAGIRPGPIFYPHSGTMLQRRCMLMSVVPGLTLPNSGAASEGPRNRTQSSGTRRGLGCRSFVTSQLRSFVTTICRFRGLQPRGRHARRWCRREPVVRRHGDAAPTPDHSLHR
jgi:hypothetical protein